MLSHAHTHSLNKSGDFFYEMSLFPARLFKKIVAQERAIQKYKAITNTMV